MRILKISMFGFAAAIGAAFVYFNAGSDPVVQPELAVAPPPIAAEVQTPLPAKKAEVAKASTEGMRRKFEDASNYAAFIHDALQRPEEGGRFYALIAYNRCTEIANVKVNPDAKLTGKPEHRDAAKKIIDDLKNKCSSVKDYFPDEIAFMRAMKNANSKDRPDALLIERGVLAASSKEAAPADIKRAVASNDPYLIAGTVDINIDHLAEQIDPGFANGQNRHVLYTASAAAACEVVGDCKDSFRVMGPCVVAGNCGHTDYREYLRESIDPESRKLFDKTKSALLLIAGRGGKSS